MNSQMKKCIGQSLEGFLGQNTLLLWSWATSTGCQLMEVFTNAEALQTPQLRDFYGGLS